MPMVNPRPVRTSPAAATKSNSQLLCCCGTSGWAKAIACIQIFVALAALSGFFMPGAKREPNNANSVRVNWQTEDDASNYFKAMLQGSDPTAKMVGQIFSLVLGFILLGAALTENTILLLIWLVPSGVTLAFLGVVTVIVFVSVIAGVGADALGIFLLLLASLVMETFFYFVIFIYRQEILENRKRRNTLKTNTTVSKPVDEFHTVVTEK